MSEYPLERAGRRGGSFVESLAAGLADDAECSMQQAVNATRDPHARGFMQRYRGVVRHLADMLEDHVVCLDVLSGNACRRSANGRSLFERGIRKRMAALQAEMNDHLPKSMRFRHVALLREALERQDGEMVEFAMAELLCHAPDDGSVAAVCASRNGSPVSARAVELLARYRFSPVARLDCAAGCVPIALHYHPCNKTLYISDFKNHLVRRYIHGGEPLTPLDIGCLQPQDMFPDEEGCLWICDQGNNRLVRLGLDDVVSRGIDLAPFCKGPHAGAGVRSGCLFGSRAHLVLVNKENKARFMATIDLNGSEPELRFAELENGMKPLRLFRAADELFMFGWPDAEVARFAEHCCRQVSAGRGFFQPRVRGLVAAGEYRFLLTENNVLKLDAQGLQVFSYSLRQVLGVSGFTALAMAAGNWGGEDALFVSDGISGDVFVFSV